MKPANRKESPDYSSNSEDEDLGAASAVAVFSMVAISIAVLGFALLR